ncbi:type II toxin-antitoxin system HipA family toxin [Microvirga arsenatis]|uniref:Type II toxin-antitoxin system HipA family toxin n=1 Tax=Microvirga arsenatis TaxID=2692265 RepID=A0ABW9Z8G7_9HYPH|nr:HipA domain-containing protein [Microvirga arsenatis]NBJ13759.1 type II toxin-antitoxin system HipA family toxin [Microvirga arsenatis]NBJ27201.1 type II toxin-antitoxin system HipA family toxin [Microvirga arsenatis]
MDLTLQLYHEGAWHNAGVLTLGEPERGHQGATRFAYDPDYFYEHGAIALAEDRPVVDARAVSVRFPVDLADRSEPTWPAFLLDLLPQGHARLKLSEAMGLDPNAIATEVPLLLRGAGAPIGNMRIKEAHEQEAERIANLPRLGVTMNEILEKSDRFLEVSDYYAMVASGSSGLQGEWPKVMMTLKDDGLWYPDSVVTDHEARRHVIVKLLRGNRGDELILEGEARYAMLAAAFGIRVHAVEHYRYNRDAGVLVIPRFDRAVTDQGLVRYGQESLVAAAGIAAFAHSDKHETYLEVLRRYSSEPLADVTEYVLRDALNLATGNPDNHGRNTALTKRADGTIRLSPLFDYAPMRIAENSLGRPTKWACMQRTGRDATPDWAEVCRTAAADTLPAQEIMAALLEREHLFRTLPDVARQHGVPEPVIERAIEGQYRAIAEGIADIAAHVRAPGVQ